MDLMDRGFAVIGPLARHRRPPIRFLFIGSRFCSTLLSGPASRRVPFPLALRYDFTSIQVVKRTFPLKLSYMLGTPEKSAGRFPAHEYMQVMWTNSSLKIP